MNEEIITNDNIKEDEEYYLVPKDEYELVDIDDDVEEETHEVNLGDVAIGAGLALAAGGAIFGIKKLVGFFKNRKKEKTTRKDEDNDILYDVEPVVINSDDEEK